jgi:hypothetical protein
MLKVLYAIIALYLDMGLADGGVVDKGRTVDRVPSFGLVNIEAQECEGSQYRGIICDAKIHVIIYESFSASTRSNGTARRSPRHFTHSAPLCLSKLSTPCHCHETVPWNQKTSLHWMCLSLLGSSSHVSTVPGMRAKALMGHQLTSQGPCH